MPLTVGTFAEGTPIRAVGRADSGQGVWGRDVLNDAPRPLELPGSLDVSDELAIPCAPTDSFGEPLERPSRFGGSRPSRDGGSRPDRSQLDDVPTLDPFDLQSRFREPGPKIKKSSPSFKTRLIQCFDVVMTEVVEFFADWLGVLRFYRVQEQASSTRGEKGEKGRATWRDHFNPKKVLPQKLGRSRAPVYNTRNLITRQGKVLKDRGVNCIASFPGKYPRAWDSMMKPENGDAPSAACVFLPDAASGLGRHVRDPDNPEGKCYCRTIYGAQDFETFGYLRNTDATFSEKQRLRTHQHARATNAVVLDWDATKEDAEQTTRLAKQRYEESGKIASWGCMWFHVWKNNIDVAVRRRQTLAVCYFSGEIGLGHIAWDDLKSSKNLWQGVGLSGSQKVEVAYLDNMQKLYGAAYNYLRIDVKMVLQGDWSKKALAGRTNTVVGRATQKLFSTSVWDARPSMRETRLNNVASYPGEVAEASDFDDDASPTGDEEMGKQEKEFSDVDSFYSGFSDLAEMFVRPWQWPKYLLLQLLLCWPLWIIYKIQEGAFVAGLSSIAPGSVLRLNHACEDLRAEFAWRLLTYQWSHAGISHIGSNTIMLLFAGLPLEGFHGSLRLALMFNVGVIGGGLCYLLADPHGPSLVGMSGGCYALLGMHLADIVMNFAEKENPRRKLSVLLLIFVLDLANVALSSDAEQDASPSHWAHLGGWLAGLMVGIVVGRNILRGYERQLQIVVSVLGITMFLFAVGWTTLSFPPRDVIDQVPWCWSRQVSNFTLFNDHIYHCIRCDSLDCVRQWTASQTYHESVSVATCDSHGGWAMSNVNPNEVANKP